MKTSTLTVLSLLLGAAIGFGVAYLRLKVLWPADNLGPSAQVAARQATPKATGPAPRLAVEGSTTYNFNEMDAEASDHHAFRLRNEGDAPLEIQKGAASCKCLRSALGQGPEAKNDDARLTLRPGEAAELTLEWSTKGFVGKFQQTAFFKTNDPNRKELGLTVSGEVRKPYLARPRELFFNGVPAGETGEAEVRVFGFRRLPFDKATVTLADGGTASFFEVQDEPLPEDEAKKDARAVNGRRFHVRVKPGLPVGPFRQRIVIRPGEDPEGATVEIPMFGTITGELSVVGAGWHEASQSVTLGAVKQDVGVEKTVQIVARGPQRGEVHLEIESISPESLQAEIGQPVELPGGQVTEIPLTLRVPKGARFGRYMGPAEVEMGEVVLKTHLPNNPQLRLWVRFAVLN